MAESSIVRSDVPTIIASELHIRGDIAGGIIEIEGRIEGNITCESATIRSSGYVTGDIRAARVQIDGEIIGLVEGSHIALLSSARVTGTVIYESLSIEEGALIDGQCQRIKCDQKSNLSDSAIEKPANDSTTSLISGTAEVADGVEEFMPTFNSNLGDIQPASKKKAKS